MKKFTSVIVAVLTLALCFALSACGNNYASNFSGSSIVTSNSSNEASISFGSFSGTYVMQFKNKGSTAVYIDYKATLDSGNIKVYYDFNGEKLNLFDIGANGSVDERTETFTGKKTIYIIIESDGTCSGGSFSFVVKKA